MNTLSDISEFLIIFAKIFVFVSFSPIFWNLRISFVLQQSFTLLLEFFLFSSNISRFFKFSSDISWFFIIMADILGLLVHHNFVLHSRFAKEEKRTKDSKGSTTNTTDDDVRPSSHTRYYTTTACAWNYSSLSTWDFRLFILGFLNFLFFCGNFGIWPH